MIAGLTLSEVSVRFRGIRALDGVGFSVAPGELTALIGPNGAGKSTLTNVICGALPASTGEIHFGGRRVRGNDQHRVAASGLVRTFQGLELFDKLTVLQNVIAGGAAAAGAGFWRNLIRTPHSDPVAAGLHRRAIEALETMGLAHRAADLAGVLPAGQRRRLAVARALATGAGWLVLDEPGAGLNAAEKTQLVAMIRRLHASGRTVLFIEHDMDVVHNLAHRILVLDRGRLIADGSPADVRADRRVISAYLGTEGIRTPVASTGSRPAPLIRVEGLGVAYGDAWALRGLDLQVGPGELVALVGANGAGKSTLLRALAGTLAPREGRMTFDGAPLAGEAESRVSRGIALVPEGRELFTSLSVEDNLLLGAWSATPLLARLKAAGARARALAPQLDRIYALFPALRERRRQLAGGLSGGEAQMVAIGRALMARPRLLLLDEPSLGLAPMLVDEILERLRQMRDDGLAILLVEQMARAALALADHGYVLERGRVLQQGTGAALLREGRLDDAYLGTEAMLERT